MYILVNISSAAQTKRVTDSGSCSLTCSMTWWLWGTSVTREPVEKTTVEIAAIPTRPLKHLGFRMFSMIIYTKIQRPRLTPPLKFIDLAQFLTTIQWPIRTSCFSSTRDGRAKRYLEIVSIGACAWYVKVYILFSVLICFSS